MSDVYVYVKPPPCAVLGDLRTVPMEGDVNLDYDRDDGELVGVEILGAVLVEVDGEPIPAQPLAPITAEDVRAAAQAYMDLSTNEAIMTCEHAFVADYLNRRNESTTGETT
jgi:uncharacterized protein YuzE